MQPGQISRTESAFKRPKFVGGGKLLLLKTPDDRDLALAAMAEAIMESNVAMGEAENDSLFAQVNGPVPGPEGPIAIVRDCEPLKAMRMMLDHIARGLEARGISGTLVPAKEQRDKHFHNISFPALTAGLFLPMDTGIFNDPDKLARHLNRVGGWKIEAELTRTVLTPLIDWVLGIDGSTYVGIGVPHFLVEPDAVTDLVLGVLPVEWMVMVTRVTSQRRKRWISMRDYGAVVVGEYAPDRAEAETRGDLTNLLRQAAPHLNAGMIRQATTGMHADRRSYLGGVLPKDFLSSQLSSSQFLLIHLEHDYVHDAYAQQVMTGSQLAKTQALPTSRWHVEALGGDRHLVTHTDPGAWFDLTDTPTGHEAQPSPVSEDVLHQARIDFGDAIMTPRTLADYPPNLPADDVEAWFKHHSIPPPSN